MANNFKEIMAARGRDHNFNIILDYIGESGIETLCKEIYKYVS